MKRLALVAFVFAALVHLVAFGLSLRAARVPSAVGDGGLVIASPGSATRTLATISRAAPLEVSRPQDRPCPRCKRPLTDGALSIYDADGKEAFAGCGPCLCELLADYTARAGSVAVPPPPVKCPACNGHGVIPWVVGADGVHPSAVVVGQIECSTCRGSGFVR